MLIISLAVFLYLLSLNIFSDVERDEIIRRQMAIFKKKRSTIHCLDPAKAYADVYIAGAEASKKFMERKVQDVIQFIVQHVMLGKQLKSF